MNCKIDYKVYTDGVIELAKKNIDALYIPNKHIKFEENTIDLVKKIYTRKTDEYELIIDFKSKECKLKPDDNNTFKFDIKCKMHYSYPKLVLEYKFEEEEKKIHILMKEVIL